MAKWRVTLSPMMQRLIRGRSPRQKWDTLYTWFRNTGVKYEKRGGPGDYTRWHTVWFPTQEDAVKFQKAWELNPEAPSPELIEDAPIVPDELTEGQRVLAKHAARTAQVVESEKRKREKKRAKREAIQNEQE
jgi:hypothetical protein